MQKLFSGLFIFAVAAALHAGGLAVDTQENHVSSGTADLQIKALEHHIRGMMTADPEKRLPELLKALELAPNAQFPLQILVQFCQTQKPPLNIRAAEGVLAVAEKNPANLLLNMEAVRMAAGLSPELDARAEKLAEQAVKHGKSPRKAFLMLVGVHVQDLMKQGKFAEAYDLLSGLLADTDTPEQALIHWAGNVCRTAARNADTARRWLGLLQSEQAMWHDRQIEAVELARKQDAALSDFPAIQRQTDFYIQMLCPADAFRIADEAVRNFTGNTDAEFLKLTVLLRIRRYQEAFAMARDLIKVSPESPGCLRLLAESAMRCGDYKTALSAGRKLLQLHRSKEGTYYTVIALILNNQPEEARKEIAGITDPEFRMSLESFLRSRTRDWTPLLARIRKLQANPNYKGGDAVYLTLLPIAEQTRDVKLLEECWQNMEKLGSLQEAEHANNVGYVATVLNHRLDEAGKLIRSALAAEPDNGAYMDSMAWYYCKTGDIEKAWKYIQLAITALEGEPSAGVTYDHAGDIALKLGRKKEALHYYRLALGDYLAPDLDLQAVQKKINQLAAEHK